LAGAASTDTKGKPEGELWRKRVRVERFRVLKTKGVTDSKTTSSRKIVDFYRPFISQNSAEIL
jgi:hypothetical protein